MTLPPESQLYSHGILEVRWHGRGGQGAWTASEILARVAIAEGKYIQSFPEFGPDRMGAPVTAFTRISYKPINLHCAVYNPGVATVLDDTLLKSVKIPYGLKEGGAVVVNTEKEPRRIRELFGHGENYPNEYKVWTVDATKISIEILGMPITNTAMLGAVARVSKVVSLETIENMVKGRFRPDVAEKNFAVVKEAYEEVKSE